MSEAADLPNDVEALKGLVRQHGNALQAAEALVISQKLELEKLRFEIARLKRMKFGRSSEQLDHQLTQMQLTLEDLESSLAQKPEAVRPALKEPAPKPIRRALPEHLPREEIVHIAPCACPACGGELRALGEDVSEMLEYVPERYQVIRHVRPKFSCAGCQKIVQAPAPGRPIARGLAGPGFLAHVLVAKYADHLPLYRQSSDLRPRRCTPGSLHTR
jgi:transposase